MSRKILLIGILAILLSSLCLGATTYYVDPCGSDDANGLSWATAFETIQKGIDSASSCDVVEVNEGTYYETIDFDGKAITVRSIDPNDWSVVKTTIIDANDTGTVVTFEDGEDANSVLFGLTITGGSAYDGGGIISDGSNPVISRCIITGNYAEDDAGGIYCVNSSSATITECIIENNTAVSSGGGIYCRSSAAPTIRSCFIYGNTAYEKGGGMNSYSGTASSLINCTIVNNYASDYGGGLRYRDDTDSSVKNCILWNNSVGAGGQGGEVYCYNSTSNPNFSYNDIEGGVNGTKFDGYDVNDCGNNITSDPCFVNYSNDDFRLKPDSPCIDAADSDNAPVKDILGKGRIDHYYTVNTGGGDFDYYDIGAYEYSLCSFGMEIESVTGDSNQVTVKTTGATYVLDSNGMDMYRRIDPNTNDYDTSNEGKGRKVTTLGFSSNIGDLSIKVSHKDSAIIDSTKATFDFKSESFFIIKAKEAFSCTHTNLIEDAPWNAPLDSSDRDLDRMWTDGYGGSLLAHLSEDTKSLVTDEGDDFTTISLSVGDETGHMVYPPKFYDFENLYGTGARPFVKHVRAGPPSNHIKDYLGVDGNDLFDADDAKRVGIYLIYNAYYNPYNPDESGYTPRPLDSDPNILGYQIDPNHESDVRDFISAAHAKDCNVLAYIYQRCEAWEYPSGHPGHPGMQPLSVTAHWMREFQKEYDFDGWYFDEGWIEGYNGPYGEGEQGVDLIELYNFFRQVRTDIGEDGIIDHHNSQAGWGQHDWGLTGIMYETYINTALTGEKGVMSYELDDLHDPKIRYYICDYGLSQAYSFFYRSGTIGYSALSWTERARLMGQNANGWFYLSGSSYPPGWTSHFKPAYDIRQAEYLNDANVPFDPDVDWPADWFKTPTNINITDINSTSVTITWTTDANADSQIVCTDNKVWWKSNIVTDHAGPNEYDSNMVTSHSLTLDELNANKDYEFKIRSNNGNTNIPGEVIWGYVGKFTTDFKFILKDDTGEAVAFFDNLGNLFLEGTLEENSSHAVTANKEFRFRDSSSNDVVIIDTTNGNVYIDGNLYENQEALVPAGANDEFIIKNSQDEIVAYFDVNGDLYLKGEVIYLD